MSGRMPPLLLIFSVFLFVCSPQMFAQDTAGESPTTPSSEVQTPSGVFVCSKSIGHKAVRVITWPVRRWRNFFITAGVATVGTAVLTAPVYPSREGPFSPAASMVAGTRDFMSRSSANTAQLDALDDARIPGDEPYQYSAQRIRTYFLNSNAQRENSENP